ncbi:hypothetical protein LR48_Vigan11g125500 [Vigna angularis]|uniref:uracil phosphoribosyltransferase n=1 Tax=Phaseolus angularis TaxID=3914 RepID=A0A0L9VT10_PHAAN|nr:hypothetical protein LR48_Vigan11g125500 [Vigna angularis]
MASSRVIFNLTLPFPSDAPPIPSTCHSLSLSHSFLFTTPKACCCLLSVSAQIFCSSAPRRTCGVVYSHMTMEEKLPAENRMLPTVSGEIQSPLAVASVEFIDPREPLAIIPILRAGLALAEHASSVLPATKTYHLGISRNEETLQPTIYLNKLPEKFADGCKIFVVDPMLATGESLSMMSGRLNTLSKAAGEPELFIIGICTMGDLWRRT